MMADCAAMTVDAITYLFNYFAERIKHRSAPEADQQLDPEVLKRRRKLQILYLELIPPLVSVTTLAAVTIVSLKQAIEVLVEDGVVSKPPDVFIMTIFSLLNLLLDGVNVCCFARAEDQVVGLPASFYGSTEEQARDEETEVTAMLKKGDAAGDATIYTSVAPEADLDSTNTSFGMIDEDDDRSSKSTNRLNLNMCSAWTVSERLCRNGAKHLNAEWSDKSVLKHVFADTLRSITTLLAACFSWIFPDMLSPADADSWGAIIISIIIIVSLGPLIQGLFSTATEIRELSLGHFSRRFY